MCMRVFVQAALGLVLWAGFASGAIAAEKVKAVSSFSVLADMVREIGGERVEVATLVRADGDAHVYDPTPADAKLLAEADLLVINGLGFEGWIERLQKSSGFKGELLVASKGASTRTMLEAEGHRHGEHAEAEAHDHHHEHASGQDHEAGAESDGAGEEEIADPHAWQSLSNGAVYVANIRDSLIAVDPEGKATYEANAARYLDEIKKLDNWVKQNLASLPRERRKIITSHDAFGYFGAAYGLKIVAPEGVSTESEASAKDVARIIRQIKAEKVPAVFIENVTDRRLLDQIARETGAKIGGKLYSDALSGPDGPAPTYLDMFRHNVEILTAALSS